MPTLCLILGTLGTYIKCAYFFRHKFYTQVEEVEVVEEEGLGGFVAWWLGDLAAWWLGGLVAGWHGGLVGGWLGGLVTW